ncbi:MAG: hypothetical protein ABIQ30_06325 [Devosia sp.]
MIRTVLTAAAVISLAMPSLAAEPTRAGSFADVISRGLYDLTLTAPLASPVGIIKFSNLDIELEKTPLVDIAAVLGGDISNEGEAGEHMMWTCYRSGDATIWFRSDGEMGDGKLTILAVEAKAPRAEWNCAVLPSDVYIDTGLPGLGATAAEVRGKAGQAAVDADGRFSYSGEAPSKTEQGFTIYQDVVYEERDGTIVAFGINQLSEG